MKKIILLLTALLILSLSACIASPDESGNSDVPAKNVNGKDTSETTADADNPNTAVTKQSFQLIDGIVSFFSAEYGENVACEPYIRCVSPIDPCEWLTAMDGENKNYSKLDQKGQFEHKSQPDDPEWLSEGTWEIYSFNDKHPTFDFQGENFFRNQTTGQWLVTCETPAIIRNEHFTKCKLTTVNDASPTQNRFDFLWIDMKTDSTADMSLGVMPYSMDITDMETLIHVHTFVQTKELDSTDHLDGGEWFVYRCESNPSMSEIYLWNTDTEQWLLAYDDAPVDLKPVIYLYPETETDVSVTLDYIGRITHTYPKYEGEWRVTAHPDGTLFDGNGREYYCLFWEGVSSVKYDMSEGFCVKGEDTEDFLEYSLMKLGLTHREANEFIIFWLPKMENNKYNLISFQEDAYTETAKLTVDPSPDTVIRVFMTWKALDEPVDVSPQTLSAPEREGFVLVEWGGRRVY